MKDILNRLDSLIEKLDNNIDQLKKEDNKALQLTYEEEKLLLSVNRPVKRRPNSKIAWVI
jgi:hypothetical protein